MRFQVSPGVDVREIDLTLGVPAISTSKGAFAGRFRWGPLNERITVSSEDVLRERFGRPDGNTAVDFFSAADFLAYSGNMDVVRVASQSGSNTALNSTSEATTGSNTAGTGLLIRNDDHYEASYDDGSGNVGMWAAKFPGKIGNSLKVSICPSAPAFQSTLTGNVAVSANSTALTGNGTLFQTQVSVGDILLLGSQEIKVASVTSNTALTLEVRHTDGITINGTYSATPVRRWEYFNTFERAPGTGETANSFSSTNDEMHVVVVDEDGLFTQATGSVLERYDNLSKGANARFEDGETAYYKEVINAKSQFVRWMDHPGSSNWGTSVQSGVTYTAYNQPLTRSLTGGKEGAALSSSDYIRGYDLFADADNVDVSLIVGGQASSTVANHIINNIVEIRKDCVAFFSPPKATVVNNLGSEATDIVAWRNDLPSASYAVMDSGWKRRYDRYNDVYIYTPLNPDVAGVVARTDNIRDPWYSPAGYVRGQIKNVYKLAYNPGSRADRDTLFKNGVNPIVQFPGEGPILFGDKTLLTRPSDFDAIGFRRLFIVLEKSISIAAKYMLFEFNDEFTQAQFVNLVEPFLREVQGRRGVRAFKVVADETVNTDEVKQRKEFVGNIFVKGNQAIRGMQLNFIAVRGNVSFEEVSGVQF